MSPPLAASVLWYTTRSAGVVSLLLLTLSVLFGVLSWSRWRTDGWPRFISAGFHRNVSLLAVVFVGLHVATTLADGYAPIRLVDTVVPFVSSYRPLWLGLGALSFDFLLALLITSLLQRYIGPARWRAVHWLAYACWPIALVHALGNGTDPRRGWFTVLAFSCAAAVLVAVLVRAARARSGSGSLRSVLAGSALAAAAALAIWAGAGPLHGGWAARAGTPRALLASMRKPAAPALPKLPFRLPLQATVESRPGPLGAAMLSIDGTLGNRLARLAVLISGNATQGGISPRRIDVTYGTSSSPAMYRGEGRLRGPNAVVADVSRGPRTIELVIDLQLNAGSGAATGTVGATQLG